MIFLYDENGATSIEYGMMIGFMSVLIVTAWGGVYTGIAGALGHIIDTLSVA